MFDSRKGWMSLYVLQTRSLVGTIHPAVGTRETYTSKAKWLGCEDVYLLLSCAEVQNAWSNTSFHPDIFMKLC